MTSLANSLNNGIDSLARDPLPHKEVVSQCHSEESFGRAQDKFRDEESAFGFVVSEHQRRLDTSTEEKQILR